MKKLIRLLKIAHAVEIGAIQAYGGHWRSLPDNSEEQLNVYVIQLEEIQHRETCENYLLYLGAQSSKFLDITLFFIGNIIGKMCYVSPKKASAFGAAIMEIIGSKIYNRLADEAIDLEMKNLASQFLVMAHTETNHEIYFKNGRVPSKESGPRNQS